MRVDHSVRPYSWLFMLNQSYQICPDTSPTQITRLWLVNKSSWKYPENLYYLRKLPWNLGLNFRHTQGIGVEEIESVWEQLPLAWLKIIRVLQTSPLPSYLKFCYPLRISAQNYSTPPISKLVQIPGISEKNEPNEMTSVGYRNWDETVLISDPLKSMRSLIWTY